MATSRHHGSDGRHRRRPATREVTGPGGGRFSAARAGAMAAGAELVGREREAAEVAALAAERRLVTLTGPPGVGKSRLARHVAVQVADPRGVYVIDLDGVRDRPGLEAASALQLGEARLSDGSLIVLDNCEHLVAAGTDAVEQFLRSHQGVRAIATSREALGVVGEAVVPLLPLPLERPRGDATSEAVQLFCDRAASAQRGFVPTPETLPTIEEICRRLDGLPLAIELAAARLAVLSLPEVADALDDRFTLLASPGGAPTLRHRSMSAALDGSYELLTASERVLLARLSVFAGGCTLDAAEEVLAGGEIHTDDVLDLLNALVAKSLVVAETAQRPARYRMLESVRLYAFQCLARGRELGEVQARNARWCVQFLDHVPEGGAREWLAPLEAEEANLAAALTWAVSEGRVRTVAALVGRVVPLWWSEGRYRDAQRWLERALILKGRAPAPLRVKLLCDAALGAVMLGQAGAARSRAQEALDVATEFDDLRGMTEALRLLGFVAALEGQPAAGAELIDEAVELAALAADRVARSHALAARARVRLFEGRAVEGLRDFEASLAASRDVDRGAALGARVGLGWAHICIGGYDDAEADLEAALRAAADGGERHTSALASGWLGDLRRLRGDRRRAFRHLAECVAIARRIETPYPLTRGLLGLGRVAQGDGDAVRARGHYEEALSVARSSSLPFLVAPALVGLGELAEAAGDLVEARRLLGEALEAARAFGDVAAEAQALWALGYVERAAGDDAQAASVHHQALTIRAQIGDRAGIADSLEAIAGVAAVEERAVPAARLLGAAHALREGGGPGRPGWRQAGYEADVVRAREGARPEDFASAWSEGERLTLDEAVAYATKGRGRRQRPEKGWRALTPAERQVVDLVAQGLTNAETAERLFISAETVKAHLSRAFPKLGVRSRRELRTLAPDYQGQRM